MLRRRSAKRRRGGFTLAEILVAFGLIAVLAAVTMPALKSRMQDGYEDSIIQEMQSLATGIAAYRQDVGHYPPSLNNLLAITTASMTDYCNLALTSADSAKWAGPYISRSFNTANGSYTIANRDAVQTSIIGNKAFTGAALIGIRIDNVDENTMAAIDLKVDGSASASAGTVRYTIATPNKLYWVVPIRNGAC